MIASNRVYDTLKFATMIVLPALATLYFALAQIWGLPFGEEIVGTIAAISAFLGVVLRISTSNYEQSGAKFDGTIDIVETADTKTHQLNFDEDPYDLDRKNEVVLKVNVVRENY